jgi:endoribonuclease LACTB2
VNFTEVKPKDAAAVVLVRGENEICWAKRSAKLKFLSGWHAFPGGRLEESDFHNPVQNCDDKELAALITCAARECFEEVGVLLARGGEKMTKGQRASLHDDLLSGRMTFAEILAHWELWLDAADFTFVGTWTTPPFSPIRFKTRFFLVNCPPKQQPYPASGELEEVEFIAAKNAWERWRRGEILCAPPILNTIRTFVSVSKGIVRNSVQRLLQLAEQEGAHPRKVQFNPHITLFPLQTLTLPPATHTNCFIVGYWKFVVIDAASPSQSEQAALHNHIDAMLADGCECQAIIVSHLHPDHVGGERALQNHILNKYDVKIPLAAHRLTAEKLPEIQFDESLEGDKNFDLLDANANNFKLEVLHTPGHARGHLAFYVEKIGFLLSSDNVVGTGSVLIAPPEGNMRDYFNSLERLKNLPNLRLVCGSHGAAMSDAQSKIESDIAHRLEREAKILQAWQNGARTTREIVQQVYTDVQPELWQLAEKSVLAHLEKLEAEEKLTADERR